MLPTISAQGVWTFLFWLLVFFLFLIIAGTLFGLWLWWFLNHKRFNITIQKFEKIDGRWKPTGKESATEKKIGKGGDTIFYWRQSKKVVPRGTIQSGDRVYYYARREDGEWENIGIEDIDFKLKQMNMTYTPVELRYAKESLREMVKEIYSPTKWWQENIGIIVSIVFIVLVTVLLLLIGTKMGGIISSISPLLDQLTLILEKFDKILGAMENVCSNSGVVYTG